MRLYVIFIFSLLANCSSRAELSEGKFSLFDSNNHKPSIIHPIVHLNQKELTKPIEGSVYINDESMLGLIAKDLGLEFSKEYYFISGGDFSNRIKIGEKRDTLEFVIKIPSDREIKSPDLGTDAICIKYIFKNKTHKSDTSFCEFFDLKD